MRAVIRPTLCAILMGGALSVVLGCGAGELSEAPPGGDAGPSADLDPDMEPPVDDYCAALVTRTCGAEGVECSASAACQAALLIQEHEEERCQEAHDDTFVYPSCQTDACSRLVDRVCGEELGGVRRCADRGTCQQAEELAATLGDASAPADERERAREACLAGLEDPVVFSECGG